eukprot:TRINITY_DN1123_c0_g1_i1.p1 TRINITY_DN1123_c0_g1~~TRINITY_DN1123_c0_g1_i1.p1  ORF type:complete len:791 (+),score=195.66 TRINITY_DN1123_c0_g1_i1:149-2521(+)
MASRSDFNRNDFHRVNGIQPASDLRPRSAPPAKTRPNAQQPGGSNASRRNPSVSDTRAAAASVQRGGRPSSAGPTTHANDASGPPRGRPANAGPSDDGAIDRQPFSAQGRPHPHVGPPQSRRLPALPRAPGSPAPVPARRPAPASSSFANNESRAARTERFVMEQAASTRLSANTADSGPAASPAMRPASAPPSRQAGIPRSSAVAPRSASNPRSSAPVSGSTPVDPRLSAAPRPRAQVQVPTKLEDGRSRPPRRRPPSAEQAALQGVPSSSRQTRRAPPHPLAPTSNEPHDSGGSSAVPHGHVSRHPSAPRHRAIRKSASRKFYRRPKKVKHAVLEHKKNLQGEIIYKSHPSWQLMLSIQAGIRFSVGKIAASKVRDTIGPLDQLEASSPLFASPPILRFPTEGSYQTPPHRAPPFKFKDYAPRAFQHLRVQFGISADDYLVSLCNTLPSGENALREWPTPGKSGSLFFFSHDMKYILKTIPKREAKLLRELLPSYFKHVMANAHTLLPRFFGLHRIKPHLGKQVRFVVMANVFYTSLTIHDRYDLKGSKLGRMASEEEISKFGRSVMYKDLDWNLRAQKIRLGPGLKEAFVDQLQRDCELLERLGVMDYSLLIGIHYYNRDDNGNELRSSGSKAAPTLAPAVPYDDDKEPGGGWLGCFGKSKKSVSPGDFGQPDSGLAGQLAGSAQQPALPARAPSARSRLRIADAEHAQSGMFQQEDGGVRAMDELGQPLDEHYFIGVIDILLKYDASKFFERVYKMMRHRVAADTVSSINPHKYAKRFRNYVGRYL